MPFLGSVLAGFISCFRICPIEFFADSAANSCPKVSWNSICPTCFPPKALNRYSLFSFSGLFRACFHNLGDSNGDKAHFGEPNHVNISFHCLLLHKRTYNCHELVRLSLLSIWTDVFPAHYIMGSSAWKLTTWKVPHLKYNFFPLSVIF